jgi:hypothetical protein
MGSSVPRRGSGTPVSSFYTANTERNVRHMCDLSPIGDRRSQCKIESALPARFPEVAAIVSCIVRRPTRCKDAHMLRSTMGCAPKGGGGQALIETPMGDPRFVAQSGPHALADIAGVAAGSAPTIDRKFAGVAPLQSAGQDEVSFLDNRRHAAAFEGWPVLPRCFILYRHLVAEFTLLRWSTATHKWMDPPRSASAIPEDFVSDLSAGSVLLGSPAQPRKEFFRQVATLIRTTQRPGLRSASPTGT